MKRLLFLTHRWLGITLCLFMAMWFFSGVVMMYVGYPKLTAAERLERLPAIDPAACCIGLGEAIRAAGAGNGEQPKEVRLTSVAAIPRYVLTFDRQRVVAVDARNGRRIDDISAAGALAAAAAFAKGEKLRYLDRVEEDAWTHSKALDAHRPLHRIQMHDGNETLLYVSSRTGEVVRDATATERLWNWAGAWIHWLYPFRGGMLDRQWHAIVVYGSLVATVLALTGLAVGTMRWKIAGHYPNRSKSPYRASLMRWHHYLGLSFGLVSATWIFSGLLSMNPWKVFDSGGAPLDARAYSGGAIEAKNFTVDLRGLMEREKPDPEGGAPREFEWRMFDGKGYLIAFDGGNRTRIFPASNTERPFVMFPFERQEAAGARLLPGARVVRREVLGEYDFYYYPRASHTMSGHLEKRLPVLRLEFDDADSTWVHLDPYTGTVAGKLDRHQRVKRWLFALLHSWDWAPLLERRPLWDALLILLSLGGFLVSCTGIVIGWRRLGRNNRRDRWNKRAPADAGLVSEPNPTAR